MPAEWGGRTPRRWQPEALAALGEAMRAGERAVVEAATGSGKSVVQAEAVGRMLPRLPAQACAVVVVPTERLVSQMAATLARRCGAASVGQYYGRRKQLRPVIVACYPSLARLAEDLRARGWAVWLVIADECHRVTESYRATLDGMAPRWVAGFTATPFRASSGLTGWDRAAYRYSMAGALADGVLVPPVPLRWWGDGEAHPDEAVAAMLARTTGPGAVNATDIADSEEYAARLCGEGIPAAAVHSKASPAEQEARLRRLRAGELRAVVYPELLGEGVDLPWLRWLALRVPIRSHVKLRQTVGRVLRVLDPVDHAEDIERHGQKAWAHVLDPAGCLGWQDDDGRTWESRGPELVAELDAAAEREVDAEAIREREADEALRRELALVRGTGEGEAGAWLDEVWQVLHHAGMADHWQRHVGDPVGDRSRATRWLPSPQRDAARTLLDRHAAQMTVEGAARLRAILGAGSRAAGVQKAAGTPWERVRVAWPPLPPPPGWLL
jgi:hypothetical protein